MACPLTTRLEPTALATGSTGVICTTGIPVFSISVVIAAPQRVLVPQVEVSSTASTPASLSLAAISRPTRCPFSSGATFPGVDINSS